MEPKSCSEYLAIYIEHLIDRHAAVVDGDACRILTPWYLPDNTRLTIDVVQREDGQYEVTDLGETEDNLFLSGVDIARDDPRFQRIAARFGVQNDRGEIRKLATPAALGSAIDDVIHAMLDTAYLVYTRNVRKARTFTAEIEKFLADRSARYVRGKTITGYSGEHRYDFSLIRGVEQVLIESLSTVDSAKAKDRAQIIAFKAEDVRKMEQLHLRFVCFADDRTLLTASALGPRVLEPLEKYGIDVWRWSQRSALLDKAAA